MLVYGAKAPEGIVAPILNLSAESSYAKDDTNLVHVNKPCDLAYIIYTSGTTGRPKGTLIEHKNIVSLFMNNHFEFDFNEHDTWTMFHSYCFDFSVWEMYGALLYGGKIIVISKDTAKNPQKFAEIITHQSVTVLNQVPSSFNNLLDTDNCKFLENLRYLIIGGEALVIDRIKPLRVNYPKLNIINIYGPTETTVYATDWPYFYGNNHVEKAPIGRPIANKKVYILDSTHLCGIGVPGELCIAGIGVARGYLNRPELTKDKFVLNPYGNGYLYRSGDLARWLPDGNIDFLGRIDEQIKIRGFRVELDEIQSVILSVANIQDVAVIVKEINGGKVICAYIVANGDIDVQSVEDALRHKLPDYMIPASITQIKSLPITRNGKLDKRALPEPEFISSTDYVAPRTHIEEALVEVFEDVLGIKHIGITDDFFRMGGDSIKVIRVVTKMRDKDYDVSVIDIMQYREIRRIANHVKAVSHVTGTEYAEKSGNIDTSISDVLTPDYTDILRKSVLEYTTDYPQDAPLLRYGKRRL